MKMSGQYLTIFSILNIIRHVEILVIMLTKSLGFHDDILVELGKDFIKICNTSNCCNTAGVSALNIMFLIYFNFH